MNNNELFTELPDLISNSLKNLFVILEKTVPLVYDGVDKVYSEIWDDVDLTETSFAVPTIVGRAQEIGIDEHSAMRIIGYSQFLIVYSLLEFWIVSVARQLIDKFSRYHHRKGNKKTFNVLDAERTFLRKENCLSAIKFFKKHLKIKIDINDNTKEFLKCNNTIRNAIAHNGGNILPYDTIYLKEKDALRAINYLNARNDVQLDGSLISKIEMAYITNMTHVFRNLYQDICSSLNLQALLDANDHFLNRLKEKEIE